MSKEIQGVTLDELRGYIKSDVVIQITAVLFKPSKENPLADGYAIYIKRKDGDTEVDEVLIASTSKMIRYIKNPNTLNTTLKDLGVEKYNVDESRV